MELIKVWQVSLKSVRTVILADLGTVSETVQENQMQFVQNAGRGEQIYYYFFLLEGFTIFDSI